MMKRISLSRIRKEPIQRADEFRRQVHRTSRILEYFSEKELQMQIGTSREHWPIAIAKELIDNSLDACEDSGILPEIKISIDDQRISVQDNGPGLSTQIIEESLDYMTRISDKSYYVSPSRGQLGNALKCVYAIPFILDSSQGHVEIMTRGKLHRIQLKLNLLSQTPETNYSVSAGFIKIGCCISVWLNFLACLENGEEPEIYKTQLQGLVADYAAFNPHATFIFNNTKRYQGSQDACRKWRPCEKIPAHWYSPERLRNLIAADIHAEGSGGRVRTIREFVSEFRGFTSPIKQQKITKSLGIAKATYLHDLVKDGDVNMTTATALLDSMKAHSKTFQPKGFGVVGEEHIKKWMVEEHEVLLDSIKYQAKYGDHEGLPYAVELAFGIFDDKEKNRTITYGLNWAPTLKDPFMLIRAEAAEALIDVYDPVLLISHLIYPQLKFLGKGKDQLEL